MKRWWLAALFVLVVGGLWLVLGRGVERGAVGAAPSAELERLPERVVADLSAAPGERAERSAAATARGDLAASETDPPADAEPRRTHLRGRVLDAAGEGLPGVPLVLTAAVFGGGFGTELGVSGANGVFGAELQGRVDGEIRCGREGRFVTLRAARVTAASAAREHVLVAAPAIQLGGTVAEVGGAPLAGASVSLEVPMSAFAGFPVPLDGTVPVKEFGAAGPDGRFVLPRVASVAGALVIASHAGFRASRQPAPTESRSDLWLELEPLAPKEPWLRGIVVHADGKPARGATVRLDQLATKSAADGSFELEREWASPEAPLAAALRGFQPAILARAGELMEQEFAPAPVRLVLGGPALTIAGRVLDEHGEPCVGWSVGLLDGTVLTPNRVPFELAEDFARSKTDATKSDERGAFELEGLLERAYVVQAYDEKSLLLLRSDSVPAGTRDLVLRVPADARHALAGRVVGRDGLPIAGAEVGYRLVTQSNGGAQSFWQSQRVETDVDGRFELAGVPRRFAELEVAGENVIPAVFAQAELERAEVVLDVARRCHMRIELTPATNAETNAEEPPDALVALDLAGEPLSIYTFQGGGSSSTTRLRLSGLGTHPLAVSEDARTLVFYRGAEELRRVEVALVPGELSVVTGAGR